MEHLLVERFYNRIEDVMPTFGHTAEEDNCLGCRESHKVGKFLPEHLAGLIKDLFGNFVALLSRIEDIFGGDSSRIERAQERRTIGSGNYFARRACHTRSRSIRLQTAVLTASAKACLRTTRNLDMPEFAGKAIMPINQFAIDDNTRADTRTEGNHNEERLHWHRW